jgi:Alr-MurF fusion protein
LILAYTLHDIALMVEAENKVSSDRIIQHLVLDSRKLNDPEHSLFFALKGPRRDGHDFIPELYNLGMRSFVVDKKIEGDEYPGAVFVEVFDTVHALQRLAANHRAQFNIPVIGITGSNGKTITKEWLYQLLKDDFSIVRSPRSYNSQIGVPLSVWQMNGHHQLGIFEAGISEQGEMIRLEKIIRPSIGVLTNIGEAHSEGFIDLDHKFREKMTLFRNCGTIILRDVDLEGRREVLDILPENLNLVTWGTSEQSIVRIINISTQQSVTSVELMSEGRELSFEVPFTDEASVENAISCYCVLSVLNVPVDVIISRMKHLASVNMRLEMRKGINQCTIINDSYSADLSSLEIALNFLDQQSQGKKTIIISDLLQTSIPDDELYPHILSRLRQHNVNRVIGIGEKISQFLPVSSDSSPETELYHSSEDFIKKFRASRFKEETILVKGARMFAFEEIVRLLEQKVHQTQLEINLSAIAHNLKEYQRLLLPSTKVMAMVKAFAYGSGGAEIAGILQYHKVDYLGVAYADEGIELRNAGISLPVMVMNPEISGFDPITSYNLEPEIFSFDMLSAFDKYLQQEGIERYPIHIEIETGMNRLGFMPGEMEQLGKQLSACRSFNVQSLFTHLASSEDPSQDDFTRDQYNKFREAASRLKEITGFNFLCHIANSAAIERHPEMQMDMVRLGIGMYGVSSGKSQVNLQTVATLRTTIAQLKKLSAGESVSYNRKSVVDRPSIIATVRIGYADGYPRRLGNGAGEMLVNGKTAPVIGTVCMDMTMLDVTDIPGVSEGDEVIVFGKNLPVETLAFKAGTIPYEIMTGISQRVKRVYYEE